MDNLVGKRAKAIYKRTGNELVGVIISDCHGRIAIYPDGEVGPADETAWVFLKNEIELID